LRAAALLLGLAVSAGTGQGASEKWPVKEKLVGKHGKSVDVSGIACVPRQKLPYACLVIDDELQAAQFVLVREGELEAGDLVDLIDDEKDGKPLSLDGEGVAYADGSFYVMGSHGHPRDAGKRLDPVADAELIKAKIAASSQIVRIRLKTTDRQPLTQSDVLDIRRSPRLREAIAVESALSPFLDRRLEDNGLTIEGIAVIGDRLFAGFRAPSVENGRAPVLSVSLRALFDGVPLDPQLFLLPLGNGRGVRDLTPFKNGLLILAGPSGSGAGAYEVYWWTGSGESVRLLADITEATDASAEHKPEALLPLDQGPSGLRVLVLSDGAEEGAPRPVVIPAP